MATGCNSLYNKNSDESQRVGRQLESGISKAASGRGRLGDGMGRMQYVDFDKDGKDHYSAEEVFNRMPFFLSSNDKNL